MSPRNGMGSGIVTSRTKRATTSRAPPSHSPRLMGTGPLAGDQPGEVEADQGNQKTMAVVFIGRPGVVEVVEVDPEQVA